MIGHAHGPTIIYITVQCKIKMAEVRKTGSLNKQKSY